ncbi:MAG: rod shape-determining protein MreD [Candidatus Eisenbacteria bacterium]|nr:rod shape-determining protein MreD [Candidatus Eisenbacteria bacterium]
MNALWAGLHALWLFAALAGVGFLLQTDVASRMSILGARPDLVLAAVVLLARRRGPLAGTLAGFAAGLMTDGLTPDRLGLHALLLGSVGYFFGHLRVNLLWETPAAAALILFLAGLMHELLLRVLLSGGQWGAVGVSFVVNGVATAAYTAALVPLVAWAAPRVVRGKE